MMKNVTAVAERKGLIVLEEEGNSAGEIWDILL
jgi:hypothetical protein